MDEIRQQQEAQRQEFSAYLHRFRLCDNCGIAYEINPRLNDGVCDDCREEINREGLE